MSKKTRLIILIVCAILFLVTTPYMVLYSLGYRIDFTKRRIMATGGIYVRVLPSGTDIIIDSKINKTTGLFSNSFFVQNLLPKNHNVLIKKDGYYDYQKNLPVEENEVTKLENVILFKKNYTFENLDDRKQFTLISQAEPEKFILKNNNLYYSDISENSQLTLEEKNTPLLKKIITYTISNNNIIWLNSDGHLQRSYLSGKNTEILSETALKISKTSYQLIPLEDKIFLKKDDSLFLFDQKTKSFQKFYEAVKDIKISPDGKKVVFHNGHEVIFFLSNYIDQKVPLNKFPEEISDYYWLNNDYLIFQLTAPSSSKSIEKQSKIVISEIDARGNVNAISLPQNITLKSGEVIIVKNSKIFFSQQDKKLYILTQNNLLVSEKLIP